VLSPPFPELALGHFHLVDYQQFVGTDVELTRVTFPPVTQECLDNRITGDAFCSMDLEESTSSELGVCGEVPNPIKKVIGGSIYKLTYQDSIAPALQSPGYEALKAFQISGSEGMSTIFLRYSYSARRCLHHGVHAHYFLDFVLFVLPDSRTAI
jgi:hypothetical protein